MGKCICIICETYSEPEVEGHEPYLQTRCKNVSLLQCALKSRKENREENWIIFTLTKDSRHKHPNPALNEITQGKFICVTKTHIHRHTKAEYCPKNLVKEREKIT